LVFGENFLKKVFPKPFSKTFMLFAFRAPVGLVVKGGRNCGGVLRRTQTRAAVSQHAHWKSPCGIELRTGFIGLFRSTSARLTV
jgi:hypothetical protein